jgi:hypothetical protein
MNEIVDLVTLFVCIGFLYAIVVIAERNRIDKDE